MNRNRLVVGIVAAIVMLLVLIVAGIRLWRSTRETPHAGQKVLVARLGYCGAEDIGPCIVSFSQDEDGNMLVNLLVPSSRFPNFYLTISREGEPVYRYECEEVEDFPTNVYCIGETMFPGELLRFTLISNKDNHVLAEGQFAIIGLLLSTPVAGALEPTIRPGSAIKTPTPMFLEVLTPVAATPTVPSTSYPNP